MRNWYTVATPVPESKESLLRIFADLVIAIVVFPTVEFIVGWWQILSQVGVVCRAGVLRCALLVLLLVDVLGDENTDEDDGKGSH